MSLLIRHFSWKDSTKKTHTFYVQLLSWRYWSSQISSLSFLWCYSSLRIHMLCESSVSFSCLWYSQKSYFFDTSAVLCKMINFVAIKILDESVSITLRIFFFKLSFRFIISFLKQLQLFLIKWCFFFFTKE